MKGASEGQGLGNAFLSHVSACDALFHLCRAFDDDDVIHVEGDVCTIILFTICLWYLEKKSILKSTIPQRSNNFFSLFVVYFV